MPTVTNISPDAQQVPLVGLTLVAGDTVPVDDEVALLLASNPNFHVRPDPPVKHTKQATPDRVEEK